MTQDLSLPVAKATQFQIFNTIKQQFNDSEAQFFKQNNEPIYDLYGRATYIYCEFLDKKIPVLTPGSFKFETGVSYNSPLAIYSDGTWANGYIHSPDGVMFTCKFLARLVYNYTAVTDTFKEDVYSKILTTTLRSFALEDSQKYGCLLELRNALSEVSQNYEMSSLQMALLYAHDFAILRKPEGGNIIESLVINPPSDNEIATVINNRNEDAVVSIIEYFITGDKRLMSIAGQLAEALMC